MAIHNTTAVLPGDLQGIAGKALQKIEGLVVKMLAVLPQNTKEGG